MRVIPEPGSHPGVPQRESLSAWKAWGPLAFVALIIILLVGAPLLTYRQLRVAEEEFSDIGITGRILASRIAGTLARGSAGVRAYVISGDERFLDDYRSARDDREQTLDRLREIAPRLSAGLREQLQEIEQRTERLQLRHEQLLTGRLSTAEFRNELPAQDSLFEAALAAANRFGVSMDLELAGELEQLRRANRRTLLLAIVSAVLAFLALVLLYRIGRELRRSTDEELALRNAALVLAGAVGVGELLDRITESAVQAGFCENAHIERIDVEGGEVEIVAATGAGAPPVGIRVSYPGSLTKEVLESGEPETVVDVSRANRPMSAVVAEHCGACAGLVIPLMTEVRAHGALVLLRSAESPYRERDVLAPRILGVLAALALRRAYLLRTAEEQRQKVERLMESKERLVRGLSHDLKNPLGAADGFAELLEDGVLDELNERQRESVGRIRASIRSAIDLIDDLHELSRAETGQLSIDREQVDVNEIVNEVAGDYRAEASRTASDLTITVESPEPLPLIRTDQRRVRQILGNLLSNAIKYTPEGRIRVGSGVRSGEEAPSSGPWIAIEVSDTGPGIPAEMREEIFREFSRLDPDATQGAGLGLAISRRIARLLGGDLRVDSVVDRGSTFTLWLPLDGTAEGKR